MNKRVVIVTGSSAGIGAATALRLAKDFTGIVLTARREQELEATAAAVTKAGATSCREKLTRPSNC
jgi:3-oxoacyl-[acyl-carrier protein] reductase